MTTGWSGGPTLAEVGERAALAAIFPRLPASDERVVGPGDDAAVLAAADGRFVITSDSLVDGPDFRREWSGPYDLGWKLAAVNLADVAAMGARPTALVVSLAVPGDVALAALERIADGLRDACAELAPGCGVEGGDLATSPVITAVATAVGLLDGRAPVLRSGARAGDVLAISGEIGPAAQGLRLLAAGARLEPFAPPEQPFSTDDSPAGIEHVRALLTAQLRPAPRVAAAIAAAAAGATAMLDVSDGLALDAARIAEASGVALELGDALRLRAPLDPADDRAQELLEAAEDHVFLAAFPPGAALPPGFVPIGRVVEGSGVLVDGVPYQPRGWDPFRP